MKTDKAVLEKGGNPWNWAFHDGFIKKKKPEHQLQGEKEVQSLFMHLSACFLYLSASRELLNLLPVVFHGLHGRKGLHQVATCSKIVHLWCSVALLISESPGWELILDWITGATPWGCGFSQPHHQHPWHTVAGPCHALQDASPSLTAAPAACKILKVATA